MSPTAFVVIGQSLVNKMLDERRCQKLETDCLKVFGSVELAAFVGTRCEDERLISETITGV